MGMIVGARDTIAAIATPVGTGGIGIVRISGPEAAAIAGRLLRRDPDHFPDRTLVHGLARDSDGNRLDDVLAVVMRAPRSFTGEDVAEIHGHGGVMNMARLLRAIITTGARPAEAGEFTRRAFENGKLDLTRAEAIVDVIEASSERAWRLAQAQLDGRLGNHVLGLRTRITDLLAEVEACIDFPEEGEEYLDSLQIGKKARALGRDIAALAGTFTLGQALRDGIDVGLVGPVNAGKSSLFNALLDQDRAIVDEQPGTTRDYVEGHAVWRGIPVTLIDTAGERSPENPTDNTVENQGIERGKRRVAAADIRLWVHSVEDFMAPAGSPADPIAGAEFDMGALRRALPDADERAGAGDRHVLHVLTKGDLLPTSMVDSLPSGTLLTSAHTGAGIVAVQGAILDRVCGTAVESDDGHVVTSERQRALLDQASAALARAADGVDAGHATEILALEIRDAAQALATLAGEEVGEEVLDALFSRFCIGK